MLSQTSELAIRTLLFLALQGNHTPLSPPQISRCLECSTSYLAKTLRLLVRAGILRSVRGAHGGVLLAREPAEITLLDIVQACQGLLIANYCSEIENKREPVCSFHRAMRELYSANVDVLSRWTLADLLHHPASEPTGSPDPPCKMFFQGCQEYAAGGKRWT